MKKFTILGAGWLGLELGKVFKSNYRIIVSSRNEEKIKIYEDEGFSSYILNENELIFLDQLLDTDYLFINFPPSKFDDYLGFLNKIYNHNKIKDIKKIIFISSTSIYPNVEGFFDEQFEIKDSSSRIVYEAEQLALSRSDIIFRVAGLVGENRILGKQLSNKIVEFPKSVINFVHRRDVINATKFVIVNNLNGIFNLCSKIHPTKEELYTFNSKKYNFNPPLFSDNKEFLNRRVNGSKIEKLGFSYDYNNDFDLK